MQLNGISLISYAESGNEATFVLETDLAGALALDGKELTVTAGKDTVAKFTGYRALSVTTVDKYTHLRVGRALDPDTAGAISDLQGRYETLKATVDANTTKIADAEKQVTDASAATSTIQRQLDALAGTEA